MQKGNILIGQMIASRDSSCVMFNFRFCFHSVVKILVLPSGPEYKVTVKGEVTAAESKPLVQKCSKTEDPPILANKQFLSWGGVQLGRTV